MINNITRFENNNLDRIMEIWLKSNLEAHPFIDSNYWTDNYDLVLEELPKSSLYLYWFKNQIVGFIGIQDNYIAGLFIDTQYRNLGIGTTLLNFIKNKYDNLFLNVYLDNEKAVQFYLNNEFKIDSKNIETDNNKYEYTMSWAKKGKIFN